MRDLFRTRLDAAALKDQLQSGHGGLQFKRPAIEQAFRRDFFLEGLPFRVVLLFMAAALVAVTPLYDSWLLQAPEDFNFWAHLIQFGFLVPSLLGAAVVSLVPRWQIHSDPASSAAAVITGLGMIAQRAIGAQYDFDMPIEFVGIVVAAAFFMGRFQFWQLLPVALGLMVLAILNEIAIVQPPPDGWYRVMALMMLVGISAAGAYSLEYVMRDAWLNQQLLREWSNRDALTGLPNRRAFDFEAPRSLRHAIREQCPITVAMADIDHFKAFNDYYGHQEGDECLRRIACVAQRYVRRPLDICARFGGEEFIIVWFAAVPEEVTGMAQALCDEIRQLGIAHASSPVAATVTISMGVVTLVPSADTRFANLIGRADKLLYQAKSEGRDRVLADSQAQDHTPLAGGHASA